LANEFKTLLNVSSNEEINTYYCSLQEQEPPFVRALIKFFSVDIKYMPSKNDVWNLYTFMYCQFNTAFIFK